MDSNLINVSKIETFFNKLFEGKLSDNIFFGECPKTVSDKWKDLVVVTCTYSSMRDAYARAYATIELYTKPNANGSKNVKLMDEMEMKLVKLVEESRDEHYNPQLGSSFADYDNIRNLHCNTYTVEIFIV